MDREPEEKSLPDLLLGHQFILEYLAGPLIEGDDAMDRVLKEAQILVGPLEARTAAFYLQEISNRGIEVSQKAEGGGEIFIPWGSVLRLWGPDREELIRIERRIMEKRRAEQTEEGGPT